MTATRYQHDSNIIQQTAADINMISTGESISLASDGAGTGGEVKGGAAAAAARSPQSVPHSTLPQALAAC